MCDSNDLFSMNSPRVEYSATSSEKKSQMYLVRRDIVDNFLFSNAMSESSRFGPIMIDMRSLIRDIDNHRGMHIRSQKTHSRKVIDRACDAALLMYPYATQPFQFKTRMDFSIFLSRVLAGEFYQDNDLGAGSGFLGSGAIDITNLTHEHIFDIKNLFMMEGEKRISSHHSADQELTGYLMSNRDEDSFTCQILKRYGSRIIPPSLGRVSRGDVFAFNIPPTIVNPENGEQFKHVMLLNLDEGQVGCE
ncbi:hypothetical protein [Dongshaea marina]|uniref:hypothetical protein n=1 Tax=Dongshaea marina TaxID=2047966 RepID=UPI00131F38F6|nr:hypothetical protein [Dongshaea marina]